MSVTKFKRALDKAEEVAQIRFEIAQSRNKQDRKVSVYMLERCGWYATALHNPCMTAEEIASAAADGFDVQ